MAILLVVFSIALIGHSYGLQMQMIRGGFRLPPDSQNKSWPELFYEQTLDHFNPTDPRTFKQRYMVNDNVFNRSVGENVILLVGGEGSIEPGMMTQDILFDTAQQFSGLAIQLEHRYYGASFPQANHETDSLEYLNSQQAIADTAFFIEAMNTKYNLTNPKWILIGGSYSGSLVAWIRYKFPHVITGAISISAPILAKVDFYEYFQTVEKSLRTYCNATVDIIGEAFETMSTFGLTEDGCEYLSQLFDTTITISNFYSFKLGLVYMFGGIVQYNKDYIPNVIGRMENINDVCKEMSNESIQPIERLANIYNGKINRETIDVDYGSWMWQFCTEFGYLQTSSENLIFGNFFSLEELGKTCFPISSLENLYGHVNRTNLIYGGLHPQMTNVLSIQGTIDPWHPLGLLKDLNEKSQTIVIEGASHCQIMYAKSELIIEPEGLQPARDQMNKVIAKWLEE